MMALLAGETILEGKYRILKLLGEGGAARVWLAEEPEFGGRKVAIKELKLEQLTASEVELQERHFRQEIEMAALLEQARVPNVVRAVTLERMPDGARLLVMEYAAGGSLSDRLARAPQGMPVDEVLRVAEDLCQALQAFHGLAAMPVHRDIKPSNILFDTAGKAYLSDFGVCQLPGRSGRTLVSGEPHPGTPLYMAPEQLASPGPLGPQADIFALGCVLFEMLTGKAYRRVKPRTLVSALRPDVPGWLSLAVKQAVEEDPWVRFANAGALAAALRERKLPPRPMPEPKTVVEVQKPTRLLPRLAAGAALLIGLAVLGFFGWRYLERKLRPQPTAHPGATEVAAASSTMAPTATGRTATARTPTRQETATPGPTDSPMPTASPTSVPPTSTPAATRTPAPTVTATTKPTTAVPAATAAAGAAGAMTIPAVQSDHPYANNTDKSWFISNDGGLNAVRLHFARVEIEDGVDRLEITDVNGVLIQIIRASAAGGLWSDIVPGAGAYVSLKTDGSGTAWGFSVDQISPEDYPTLAFSPHPYPNDSGQVTTLVNSDSNPAGTRVHFSRIELEDGVDYLVILSSDDVPYQWITGSYPTGLASKAVPGAAIKVKLVSDGSGQAWGYNVDSVSSASPDREDAAPARTTILAESNHPYANGLNQTWTLTNPDASAASSKIHFSRIELQTGDSIQILDSNDVLIQSIGQGTSLKDWWSDYVPGRVVQVRFATGGGWEAWGFRVDGIVTSEREPGLIQSDHPYANGVNKTWTLTNPDTGARSSKIHFHTLALASGDTIEILDSNDVVIQTVYPSRLSDWWSDYVPGRVVKVRFVTTGGWEDWGLRVDRIVASVAEPGLIQSNHPYANNVDRTWTLTNPDTTATSSRLHFQRIELERGDSIQLMDSSGTLVQTIGSGTQHYDWWSEYIPGRAIRVRFVTTGGWEAWGFRIDRIESK